MSRFNLFQLTCAVVVVCVSGLASGANPNGTYRMIGVRQSNFGGGFATRNLVKGNLFLSGTRMTGIDNLNEFTNLRFAVELDSAPMTTGRSVVNVDSGRAQTGIGTAQEGYELKRGIMIFKVGQRGQIAYRGLIVFDSDDTVLAWDEAITIRGAKPRN